MKNNLKLSIIFTAFGIIATISLLMTQQGALQELLASQENAPSASVLNTITIVQTAIMTFIFSIIGLTLAPKVNLHLPFFRSLVEKETSFTWSKKWVGISIAGGAIGSTLMVLVDKYLFMPNLPAFDATNATSAVWWKGFLASVLYGGIWEEVAMRLFLMTLLVWIISKLFRKTALTIPSWMYWFGIIGAAVLFGVGHLPANQSLFGVLTPLVIFRAILLNGFFGIFFGYLYWKKGLVYAMIAHIFAHVMNYMVLMHIFS